MGGIWHDTEADGTRVEVPLDDKQAELDAQLVEHFQAIEGNVSLGGDPNDVANAVGRNAILTALDALPARRAAHWRRELTRVGVRVPTVQPKAPEPDTTAHTTGKKPEAPAAKTLHAPGNGNGNGKK